MIALPSLELPTIREGSANNVYARGEFRKVMVNAEEKKQPLN